jgi:hypothetical protein
MLTVVVGVAVNCRGHDHEADLIAMVESTIPVLVVQGPNEPA